MYVQSTCFTVSVFGKSGGPCQVRGVSNQLADALFRLLDTFFLTVTCKGQIVLVSPSIEQHLGHCQVRLRNLILATETKKTQNLGNKHLIDSSSLNLIW